MDALNDDRGQSTLFAAALIAFGVIAVAGLREMQWLILMNSASRSAGEAAVEAATAVVADAYSAELRARADPSRKPIEFRAVVNAPAVQELARHAADDMSSRNGGPAVADLTVGCDGASVRVVAVLAGATFRAAFAGECSQR